MYIDSNSRHSLSLLLRQRQPGRRWGHISHRSELSDRGTAFFRTVWECISDCWHITTKDLEFIKIDFSRIPNEIVEAIAELYDSYEMQLEKSKVFIGSVQTSYIYQHKLHKPMIDEIDNLIARIFYLTDEELAFIKSYQEKYRLNTEKK